MCSQCRLAFHISITFTHVSHFTIFAFTVTLLPVFLRSATKPCLTLHVLHFASVVTL